MSWRPTWRNLVNALAKVGAVVEMSEAAPLDQSWTSAETLLTIAESAGLNRTEEFETVRATVTELEENEGRRGGADVHGAPFFEGLTVFGQGFDPETAYLDEVGTAGYLQITLHPVDLSNAWSGRGCMS